MRLYRKEINRILHSKMVLIFIIIGWIISVLLSIPPVYYMGVRIFDQNGNEQQLTGVSAIQYMKESGKEYDGEVLPDKLNQAMTIYREVTNQYGDIRSPDFPWHIYNQELLPFQDLNQMMVATYSSEQAVVNPEDLTESQISSFYEECQERLKRNIISTANSQDWSENAKNSCLKMAIDIYNKVDKPFVRYGNVYSTDPIDYMALAMVVLVVIAIVIASTIFSRSYEDGSDQILRCTRRGRKSLAPVRLAAIYTICIVFYVVGMGIHLLVSDFFFGTDVLKTSVQVFARTDSLLNMNAEDFQVFFLIAGIIICLSSVALTSLVSAFSKSNVLSIVLALVLEFIPTVIYFALGNTWLSVIMPGSGVSITNDTFVYQALDVRFLAAGDHVFWVPAVLLISDIIGILVCTYFAQFVYRKGSVLVK